MSVQFRDAKLCCLMFSPSPAADGMPSYDPVGRTVIWNVRQYALCLCVHNAELSHLISPIDWKATATEVHVHDWLSELGSHNYHPDKHTTIPTPSKCVCVCAGNNEVRGNPGEQPHHHGGVQDITAGCFWSQSQQARHLWRGEPRF